MRRPLSSELTAEEKKVAIRWATAIASLYSTIAVLIVGGIFVLGSPPTADNVSIAANSDRKPPLQAWQPDKPSANVANPSSTARVNRRAFTTKPIVAGGKNELD